MSVEESAVFKSPLDKPLHQLTEEDISQVTREDCRRYLKEKGMRKPSWNKSQAVQQVISLKALLETTSDSDAAAARRKLHVPGPGPDSHPHRVPKGTNAEAEISVSAEDSVPCVQRNPENYELSGDLSGHQLLADSDFVSPRTTGTTTGPVGQMTIFYCGKVNVYDDVSTDKAREIMQLAASPLHVPQGAAFNRVLAMQPSSCHLQTANVNLGSDSSMLPALQTVKFSDNSWLQKEEKNTYREDNPAEGPGSRKASVQRYLEKRKDRFKSKRKIGMPSSTSLDIYLSYQMGSHISNEQLTRSETCSPPQNISPSTPNRCSSLENDLSRNANQSAGLNGKDVQD